MSQTKFEIAGADGLGKSAREVSASDMTAATNVLLDELDKRAEFSEVQAIGHRVVHGMDHSQPERITDELLQELKGIKPFDPDHLPSEIELIEACRKRHPELPQVACFDTAFHQTMPPRAKLMPIPRRYRARGVRRYGFHGISYSFLVSELERLGDPAIKSGRVILAHLGNGASMAAVKDGESIDTSMGFTPTSGLVMGTRSGDLDPELLYFLAKTDGMTVDAFQEMINRESGLLGVSETSSDMRDLLQSAARDDRASEAVELFCYQAKKWIGSFSAALNGLDTLVFSGGIGENSPEVRERICQGLDYLGIELDQKLNDEGRPVISKQGAKAFVRVIPTDEERMIAKSTADILNLNESGEK